MLTLFVCFRLRDLGLEQFDTVELFAQILLPAAFLLACILQLHYFNCDFLTLTDLQNVPVCDGTSKWVKYFSDPLKDLGFTMMPNSVI